ncbi:hypothetical protein BDV98DRAFT_603362, partial [Pterulicium gracile]
MTTLNSDQPELEQTNVPPPPSTHHSFSASDPLLLPNDPPPPYREPDSPPSRRRRSRRHGGVSGHSHHTTDTSYHDDEIYPNPPTITQEPLNDVASETRRRSGRTGRARGTSITSTVASRSSNAPSLTHTLASMFKMDRDDEDDEILHSEEDGGLEVGPIHLRSDEVDEVVDGAPVDPVSVQTPRVEGSRRRWLRRYFRPLRRPVYWWALFHLVVLNFPFALAAWLFLFVLTVTGTTLLVALPIGAFLCFVNLIGARLFARAELALQATFHPPPPTISLSASFPSSSSATSTPSIPLSRTTSNAQSPQTQSQASFTRLRPPTAGEVEAGADADELVEEGSFYQNAYAMFFDPTSYTPLPYFLLLKPLIVLPIFALFLPAAVLGVVLVGPMPMVLRAGRRVGRWQ